MSEQLVTVWSGSESTDKAYERVRPMLDRVRPQGVQLHAGAYWLAAHGVKLHERVRADRGPGFRIWWAIAGDADKDGVPGYSDGWEEAAVAAQTVLDPATERFLLNCEQAWKKRPRAAARTAVMEVREAAPRVVLAHSAYDGPVAVRTNPGKTPARYWGGHSDYPWDGFIGPTSPVKYSVFQIYFGTPGGALKPRGAGTSRLAYHKTSLAAARKAKIIAPDLQAYAYLQSHDCRTDELCIAAEEYPLTGWWAAPTRVDDSGERAVAAMSALHVRGQTILQFQKQAGLKQDRIVGAKTLAALGINF